MSDPKTLDELADEYGLSEDERYNEPAPTCWEDVASDEAGVPRVGPI